MVLRRTGDPFLSQHFVSPAERTLEKAHSFLTGGQRERFHVEFLPETLRIVRLQEEGWQFVIVDLRQIIHRTDFERPWSVDVEIIKCLGERTFVNQTLDDGR